jgi:hypothetical protein
MRAHRHRWDRGADDLWVRVGCRRGMIEEVFCSAARFVEVGERIREMFPLVHVLAIDRIQGRGKKLATSSPLSMARSLQLRDLVDDDWEQIVRSPHLARVEKLAVALPRPIDLAWLLDRLATGGLRFTQFYNCARCCPSRAALLTGLYPHQTGIGHLLEDWRKPGYTNGLNESCVTIAQLLGEAGYRTYHSGKW